MSFALLSVFWTCVEFTEKRFFIFLAYKWWLLPLDVWLINWCLIPIHKKIVWPQWLRRICWEKEFYCFSVHENYDTTSVVFLTFELLIIRNIPIIQCIIHNIIWIWIWCGIEKTVSLAHLLAFWTFFEFAAKDFYFVFL